MLRLVLKRLGLSLLLAFAVTFIAFAIIFSNGSNIARTILGADATEEQVQALTADLGLDRSVFSQFGEWLISALQGDLGTSYFTNESVTSMLSERIPVTIALIGIAMLLTAVLSAILGVASAVSGGWLDRVLQVVAMAGTAVPNFITAIVLVMFLAVGAGLFPATGFIPLDQDPVGWALSLTLPVAAIVITSVGPASQQFRGAVIEVLDKDFVRTLRARGVSSKALIFRHVLRNAAGPGIIILGLQIIVLMGGVVVIERVFALPGVGDLTVTRSLLGDIPVVMGCVLFIVLVVLLVNLITDLINAALNPKVRSS